MDTSTAKVGDLVHGDYIEEMMCCLPPVSLSDGCSQLGEPYTHAKDDGGHWRPTFLTWHLYERYGNPWNHDSIWVFDGACFAGENKNTWKEFE